MLLRIDHVGIACHDLDEKISFYEKVFDVTVVSRETNEEQGVNEAMLHVADGEGGGSYIQLVQPLDPDSPVGRFLDRRGEGIHHIAYGVPDLPKAIREMEAAGIRVLDKEPRHGAMGSSIAFLHPKDVGGVLTELVESPRRQS